MSKVIGVTVGTTLSASSVANALKGTASGSTVVLKDVSPLAHEIKVKLSNKKESIFLGDESMIGWSGEFEYSQSYPIEDTGWDDDADCDAILFNEDCKILIYSFDHGISSIDEINPDGDYVRVEYDEDFGSAYIYIDRGGNGDISSAKVTVSGVEDHIYIGSPSSGDGGGSCFDSGETNFTVQNVENFDDGYSTILFTDGNEYYGESWNIERNNIQEGDRMSIEYSYDTANEEYVPSMYLVRGEYREPTEHTPNADGTVSGIIGDGRPMTISNDVGAFMEAEYNRDINKAFAELLEKIGR